MNKKVLFLTSLGAGLEYYDFIIYGMLAKYLSTLFFDSSPLLNLLQAFAIFALGYLVRPFGGIFFGMIGDTLGRKKALLSVMLVMGLSTLALGFLPTIQTLGILAPFLLLTLRILQGLSFGAELPGSITFVCESTKKSKECKNASFVISSIAVGSSLATLALTVLTSLFSEEEILAGAWRIPFLFGGGLALFVFLARHFLKETPEFELLQRNRRKPALKEPFLHLFKTYPKTIFQGIGILLFSASLVIFNLYLPTYFASVLPAKEIFFLMTIGTLWSACLLPFAGKMVDKWGKTKTILFSCLGGLLLSQFLDTQGFASIALFILLLQSLLALLMASVMPLLASLFPTEVRFTGVAACYNITYSLMGFAPMLLTVLPKTGAVWFLLSMATFSLLSNFSLRRHLLDEVG